MFAEPVAASAGFDADHLHVSVLQEFVKQANCVRAAANTSEKMRGQALFRGKNLRARFAADAGMKIANHRRIGMRAENRTQEIVRGADVGHPVAHGFVDGVLERAAAGIDADHLRAEHAHARNVQCLALHVFRAHIDDTFKAEMRGHRGARDAVLAGACFRNDPRLLHLHREKALADGVIDFVCAGMQQVFALEINPRATKMRRKAFRELQRCRPPREILQQIVESSLKNRVSLGLFVNALKFEQRHHQRFRNVPATIRAEAPGNRSRNCQLRSHRVEPVLSHRPGQLEKAPKWR